MWRDLYIAEKLREWEVGPHTYLIDQLPRNSEPMVWPVIRAVGRRLQAIGVLLESWAASDCPEPLERRPEES